MTSATPEIDNSSLAISRWKPEKLDWLVWQSVCKPPSEVDKLRETPAEYGRTSFRLTEWALWNRKGELYFFHDGKEMIGHALVLEERPPELMIQKHLDKLREVGRLCGIEEQLYYDHLDTIEPPGMAEFFEIAIRPDLRKQGYSEKFLSLIRRDWKERHGEMDMMDLVRANHTISMRAFNRVMEMSFIRFQGEPLKENTRAAKRAGIKNPYRSNETNLRGDTRVSPIKTLPVDCQPSDVWKPGSKDISRRKFFILPIHPGEQDEINRGGVSFEAIQTLKKVMTTGKDPVPGKHFVVTGVFKAKELEQAGISAEESNFYLYLTRDWNWKKPQ